MSINSSHPASTIYVSTACLAGTEGLMSRLVSYQKAGLEAVELGARVHLQEDDLHKLADLDQKLLIHNYFPPPAKPFFLNLASNEPDIYQASHKLISQAIALSSQLKSPFYSFHAGFVTDPRGVGSIYFDFPEPEAEDTAQRAFDQFVKALANFTQEAQAQDVGLLIENNVCPASLVGKLLFVETNEFVRLFEYVDHQTFGILLDFGHLNVAAHTLGFDRMTFIDRLTPFIQGFHVHDNDGTDDLHQPIEPDSWVTEVLSRPEFAQVPLVVEAMFDDVASLARHVNCLYSLRA